MTCWNGCGTQFLGHHGAVQQCITVQCRKVGFELQYTPTWQPKTKDHAYCIVSITVGTCVTSMNVQCINIVTLNLCNVCINLYIHASTLSPYLYNMFCLILGPVLASQHCSHAFWVLASLHLSFLNQMFSISTTSSTLLHIFFYCFRWTPM